MWRNVCWLAATVVLCLISVLVYRWYVGLAEQFSVDAADAEWGPRGRQVLDSLSKNHRKPTVACLFLAVGELEEGYARAEGVANLKYARADQERLAKAMSSLGVPEANRFALFDEQATLAGVDQLFAKVSNQVQADDTVILFFIGHGTNSLEGQSELLLHDGHLPVKKALEQLGRVPASRLLAVIDACRAGNAGRPRFTLNTDGIRVNGGLALLASSRADQFSWEADSLKHGVFSHHLAEILENPEKYDRDRDGWLSLDEIGEPVKANVAKWMITQKKEQEPICHRIEWTGAEKLLPVPQRWGISIAAPGTLQTKVKVWYPPSQVGKDGQQIMLLVKPASDGQYWPQPLTVVKESDRPGCVKTVTLGTLDGRGIGEDFRILLVVVDAEVGRRFCMGGGYEVPTLASLNIVAEETVRRIK